MSVTTHDECVHIPRDQTMIYNYWIVSQPIGGIGWPKHQSLYADLNEKSLPILLQQTICA